MGRGGTGPMIETRDRGRETGPLIEGPRVEIRGSGKSSPLTDAVRGLATIGDGTEAETGKDMKVERGIEAGSGKDMMKDRGIELI
jgi:hypothetical protein